MKYLDFDRLAALDAAAFLNARPYPWVNPEGLLTDEGYERLRETLPPISMFTPMFGVKRSHGQQPHDRYALEYEDGLEIAEPWHAFVEELQSDAYMRFLERMFGRGRMQLNFHWHYTPNGCSVSPHCDATRKIGSHIFYFNTAQDWRPEWGGETVVLDDGGRFKTRSAPAFEDFDLAISGEALGNRSLLFKRQGNSWHGVREISCPEGAYRKVFIVVINDRLKAFRRRVIARLRGEGLRDY